MDPNSTVVHPFSNQTLVDYFKSTDMHFLRDRDDDVQISYNTTEDLGFNLKYFFRTFGDDDNLLSLRCYAETDFPASREPEMLRAINKWNDMMRWPKVVWRIVPDPERSVGYLSCEQDIDLESGVLYRHLNDIVEGFIHGAYEFWEWLKTEANGGFEPVNDLPL
ncbi:MAG: YbjN domain-containing protein [Thermomicrobiales bacterium]